MASSDPRLDIATQQSQNRFARTLGLFDASMIVMGGIVGAGIFINPYVVAQQVHTPVLILGAWIAGGIVALLGAFIYAELAARLPEVGGQYAYLRDAYHPAIGFLYGWALLLVIQTGGMAAVSITFARYFLDLTGLRAPEWLLAALALGLLTLINCLGVKQGSAVQSALMVTKIVAIAAIIFCGAFLLRHPSLFSLHPVLGAPLSLGLFSMFGAAMVPVIFAYGGWQTAGFVAAEVREPERNVPRGLLLGVTGVAILYTGVSWVCLRVLGAEGLAATHTPASAVMRIVLGEPGVKLLAVGIAISTLGFLSQSILTAPRVYFAMADDGLFFRSVARIHPRTRVPVVAIVLQSVWTMVIAVTGRYEQILNYVIATDALFFGLTAMSLFVFRRRDPVPQTSRVCSSGSVYRVPGHPFTTVLFIIAMWLVVINAMLRYPANSLIGTAIVLAGIPVYFFWQLRAKA
ncbi:MAG: APC family permease [Terriglobales bacterium]